MLCNEKLQLSYLDNSINLHSDEKSEQLVQALSVLGLSSTARILEVGPGGGAALDGIAESYTTEGHDLIGINFTLLELFDSKSISLDRAVARVQGLGAKVLHSVGDVTNIPAADSTFEIVNCSSVFHEVFSYAGGMKALKKAVNEIGRVTKEEGMLLYRDIYPVDINLELPVEQVFERDSWRQFAYLFLPYFLGKKTHLYENFRAALNASSFNANNSLSLDMPAGLARELQRHYITLRDHLVKSGALNFDIDPTRYDDTEWVRTDKGFEKKIYLDTQGADDPDIRYLQDRTGIFLPASEFEDLVDDRLASFLHGCISEVPVNLEIFREWLVREGRESYVYATTSGIVDIICEAEPGSSRFIVANASDYQVRKRDFYTQYLQRVLGQYAFTDGKLMINFSRL